MKRLLIFLIPVALLVACMSKPPKPKGIIPEETMVLMLTDIHFLEGVFFSIQVAGMDTANLVTYKGYNTVFAKYKTTPEQFKKSWTFYMSHPEYSDPIYEKVVENITILQTESLKKQKAAKK
ncbi:MAG: DUF4296 domain-containing protein [Bacteroidia bacterium]|nr:DUF4296 domain-containing protein [Bacteroidia bacterium]